MDWLVAVSPDEVAAGELTPQNESAAHAAFQEHGAVLLRGALPPATVDAMYREYAAQLGTLDLAAMRAQAEQPPPNRLIGVGGSRYDVTLRMTGAFGSTQVLANGLLIKFLGPLLGKDMRLNSLTVVVSHPGAPQQQAHRDNDHLFAEPGVGPGLPVYAVNVSVPLIDVDLETGPTGIWLGSHRSGQTVAVQRSAMTVSPWQRGDCILMDYRTLHAGLANRSARARPIVYLVYGRRWFADDVNHMNRIPLDMPLEHYETLPGPVRPLLVRAYTHAIRLRWPAAGMRAPAPQPAAPPAVSRPAADPSSFGKVGRNDPCPCGSGKKYKHCHGRSP